MSTLYGFARADERDVDGDYPFSVWISQPDKRLPLIMVNGWRDTHDAAKSAMAACQTMLQETFGQIDWGTT